MIRISWRIYNFRPVWREPSISLRPLLLCEKSLPFSPEERKETHPYLHFGQMLEYRVLISGSEL